MRSSSLFHHTLSRRVLAQAALAAPIVACVSSPAVSLAEPRGLQLIDFTQRLVSAEAIAAAGFHGALVYVSELRPTADFDFKPVTRHFTTELRRAGLHIVSCYQYGKPGEPTPSDYTRGFEGGIADAHTALRLHEAAGGPVTAPIFFAIDEDISEQTWKSLATPWLRGIHSVLGVARTGIYGHARACSWAARDELIGFSSTRGHRWSWQTRAWSAGRREPSAVLFQTAVHTPSTPGPMIGGVHVDVDDVLAKDFGQWDLSR